MATLLWKKMIDDILTEQCIMSGLLVYRQFLFHMQTKSADLEGISVGGVQTMHAWISHEREGHHDMHASSSSRQGAWLLSRKISLPFPLNCWLHLLQPTVRFRSSHHKPITLSIYN
jgi:hypothetical protein